MSDLKTQINDAVKTAMREKDKARLSVLRLITAAIKQREVDERIELDDEQVLAVLDKMLKQRRDSIKQYEAAARQDLLDQELFEVDIIQAFMPEQLGDDEIKALIDEAVAATGAASMKDMGKVMGMLKPKLQGRADMGAVSSLIKSRLS